MLVLSRQCDERIVIEVPASNKPQHVEVVVADIRGDKVRIGVDAARVVQVHRKEVYERILREAGIRQPV